MLPADIWHSWNWNPLIGAALALFAWRYMDGVWKLWRRAGTGRGVKRWQVTAFWAGILALFVALISPLDRLSEVLLAAHMTQHLLLMQVAAPLLIIGAPPLALAWALPGDWRPGLARWWHRRVKLRQLWQMITQPVVVWVLYAVTLWGWHVPALYGAALRDPMVHLIEHVSFLIAALLFWQVLIHPRFSGLGYGGGVLFVFTTALHSSLLGALMTFSAQTWYPHYEATTAAWGLTALEDQQVAGLIMWVPGGIIYLAAVLLLLGRWLHEMDTKDGLAAPSSR